MRWQSRHGWMHSVTQTPYMSYGYVSCWSLTVRIHVFTSLLVQLDSNFFVLITGLSNCPFWYVSLLAFALISAVASLCHLVTWMDSNRFLLLYMYVCACICNGTAQWLRGTDLDSRLWESRLQSCDVVLKPWASFFTLHCSSSLSCINENLAIDSGGYVYEQPSRINCSIWLDASQRSRDGVWVNRSVREVKCKALWTVLRTGCCVI